MAEPIIHSLLDTDLYKLSMMQLVFHRFAESEVEYRFTCRTPGVDLTPYLEEFRDEIGFLVTLTFAEDELQFLDSLEYIKPDFVEYLRGFRLNEQYLHLGRDGNEFRLSVRGPWLDTILFEVPLLAIINEVYFRNTRPVPDYAEGARRLEQKLGLIGRHPDFKFTDFGTRRRFSRDWQRRVVTHIQAQVAEHFAGTSNVLLARDLDLVPVGTMAHEYLQACQALAPRIRDSQRFALQAWLDEYEGHLGIALTDVIGMDAFLRDFDRHFAERYAGMRQDSGEPLEWARKALEHYEQLGISPKTRTLVFSDGLTIPRALTIYEAFGNEARLAFGIGTNLTNDLCYKALDIVIKMCRCNGQTVAKISDSRGKSNREDIIYLNKLAHIFNVKL